MADQPFLASNSFNGDGVTVVWEFSFEGLATDAPITAKPYIDSADVRAELITGEGEEQVTVQQAFLFETANSIRIEPAVPVGTVLRIYRVTENRFPLVNYQDLQSVGASDLDLANRQAVYIVQEARDAARGAGNLSAEALAIAQGAAMQAEDSATAAEAAAALAAASAAEAAAEAAGVLGEVADILDLSTDTIQQDPTGSLWVGDTPAAKVNRINDRLFIGDLTDNDGANPSITTSWLGVGPQPGLAWIERNATAGSYASKGAIGFAGAAHTADLPAGSAALGLIGVAVNDNEVDGSPCWGLYLDAKSYAGALGATFGCELEVANLGAYVGDYSADPRKTTGLDIGAGADPAINGLTDSVTFGLRFINNGANFGVGISFGATSLRDFTDTEGLTYRRAAVLRANQAIGWEDSAGGSLGKFWSTVSSPALETSVQLTNNNVLLKGAAGARVAQFGHVASGVNHVFCSNAVAGSSPSFSVAGTDTDIDVRLIPKGAGRVRFGTMTGSADVAIIGSIEIKDSSGTLRKLAVIA